MQELLPKNTANTLRHKTSLIFLSLQNLYVIFKGIPRKQFPLPNYCHWSSPILSRCSINICYFNDDGNNDNINE